VPEIDPGALPPLLDAGNALLAQVPVSLVVGSTETDVGKQGVVTVRTPSTTLTVVLDRPEIELWIQNLTLVRDGLDGLIVPARGPSEPLPPREEQN